MSKKVRDFKKKKKTCFLYFSIELENYLFLQNGKREINNFLIYKLDLKNF